jgi:hypothetical protein
MTLPFTPYDGAPFSTTLLLASPWPGTKAFVFTS